MRAGLNLNDGCLYVKISYTFYGKNEDMPFPEFGMNAPDPVYRIKADGSSKDIFYVGTGLTGMVVHRGYMYFQENMYLVSGDEDYRYQIYEIWNKAENGSSEVTEWGLYTWDKKEIGTLKGKPFTEKKLTYDKVK